MKNTGSHPLISLMRKLSPRGGSDSPQSSLVTKRGGEITLHSLLSCTDHRQVTARGPLRGTGTEPRPDLAPVDCR